MDPVTGRCAILFPHGVLFRDEEDDMRGKLVESDLVDTVIGVGPNLFFNSPMEACIVICRTKKDEKRIGNILFIDTKNEVTRKNAQSYLEEEHIQKIKEAYEKHVDIEGFCKVVSNETIKNNRNKLSIALYVSEHKENAYVQESKLDDDLTSYYSSEETTKMSDIYTFLTSLKKEEDHE